MVATGGIKWFAIGFVQGRMGEMVFEIGRRVGHGAGRFCGRGEELLGVEIKPPPPRIFWSL